MELLNIKNNRPFNIENGNGGSFELIKDLALLNVDQFGHFSFDLNGEVKEGDSLEELKSTLSRLATLIDKKNRKKTDRKIAIFVNTLGILKSYIREASQEAIEEIFTNKTKRKEIILGFRTKHFDFRNFSVIMGKGTLEDLNERYELNKDTEIEIMKAFIELRFSQGLTLKNLNKSFAACTQKLFYKRFTKEETADYMNEIYTKKRAVSKNVFNDLMKQTNRGFMTYNEDYKRKLCHNVISFDISSSYPSQFIKGNDFPIGHITYKTDCNWNDLIELIKNDKWFLAVFSSTEQYNGILSYEKIDDRYWYFVNKYDYKCLKLFGKKLKDFDFYLERLLICDEEGYLNKNFRKKLHECYLEKEQSEGGKRYQLKTEIDTLYGKGIQERNINEINPLIYYGHKEHYICPQFSFHALSRARYELISILTQTDLDLWINSDTDCIKTMDRKIYSIIEKRNKEIIEENRCAGFDSNCGIWKFEGEYDNFIQYCNKVYAYSYQEEIHCTFAGCLKTAWMNYFKDKSIEESIEILNGDFVIPKGRKVLLRKDNLYIYNYEDWKINEEEL